MSAKEFKKTLFIQGLISLLWALDLSIRPFLLKKIFDEIGSTTFLTSKLILLVTIFLLSYFVLLILYRIHDYLGFKVDPQLRKSVVKNLLEQSFKHSYGFFQNQFSGSMTNRIRESMSGVADLINITINDILPIFISFIVAFSTLKTVKPFFSYMMFFWIFIFILSMLLSAKHLAQLNEEVSRSRSKIMGYLVDIFQNIFTIKLFTMEKREVSSLQEIFSDYQKKVYKKGFFQQLILTNFQQIVFFTYQFLCLYFLIKGYYEKEVTLGDIIFVLTLNQNFNNILWHFSRDIIRFTDAYGMIKASVSLFYKPLEIIDGKSSLKIKKGSIAFNNVNFSYDQMNLFQGKNVFIKGGEKVGLVGHSGSGKTTFVHLILRFFNLKEGKILIDDQSISDLKEEFLKKSISFIPQEPSVFNRTIFDNIAYDKFSLEEVMEAAKKAEAHDFIMKTPKQYETLVGEKGFKLSGGQKQRLAIARAILKNAPIFILDEATSQLDSLTEESMNKNLWSFLKDKTVIVIAHRLSTLMKMDRILVFKEGKIIEEGSHEYLLKNGPYYKSLWDAQVGGFLLS